MRITLRTPVQGHYQAVLARFDQSLFEQLTPPGAQVKLKRFDGSKPGDVVHIQLKLFGFIKQDWVSEITEVHQTERRAWFTDEGTRLPFFLSEWQHRHIVENHGSHSIIVDDIHFRSPSLVLDPLLFPVLWLQFAWRKPVYQRIFGKWKPK